MDSFKMGAGTFHRLCIFRWEYVRQSIAVADFEYPSRSLIRLRLRLKNSELIYEIGKINLFWKIEQRIHRFWKFHQILIWPKLKLLYAHFNWKIQILGPKLKSNLKSDTIFEICDPENSIVDALFNLKKREVNFAYFRSEIWILSSKSEANQKFD